MLDRYPLLKAILHTPATWVLIVLFLVAFVAAGPTPQHSAPAPQPAMTATAPAPAYYPPPAYYLPQPAPYTPDYSGGGGYTVCDRYGCNSTAGKTHCMTSTAGGIYYSSCN